jgi:hypothetical protein
MQPPSNQVRSEVTHPIHGLSVREYGSGYVTIIMGGGDEADAMIQLDPEQAKWLARELEHLA